MTLPRVAETFAHMARSKLLVAALSLAALILGSAPGYPSSKTPARAQAPLPGTPIFVISGRGWGHGVGMAQWGAFGFAQQGATYDEILAHYYRGTTLGPAEVTRVRVLLAQGRSKLSVSSAAPFTARDGLGQVWHLPVGAQTLGPGLRLKTSDRQEPQRVPGPVTFLPGTSPLRLGGRPYRGQFLVSVASGALRAVNSVSLEAYLYGVVPSEMPKEWLPEALKAQAVAARTYALAVRKTGSWFDLYPDTRSQVYLGISHEAPSTTAAVQETAGEVVLYQGRIAKTYFFSSSGGRTASAPEVWPTSPPTPYLVSVPDPYDTISPHHRWGPFVVTASRLRRVMRARGKLTDLRLETGPSGRVETATAVGEQGESTVTGSDLRRALDLRSTWFRIGVLSLATPDLPVTFGKKISLSGVARSVPSVRLDQRQPGASWQQVGPVSPGPGGVVTIKTKPRLPTDYRLTSGLVRSSVAHVSVAPLVRFQGMPTAGKLRGYARPLFPGASVAIQRFDGSSWRAVARATIDANGSFEATVSLSPGEYRARLAPGRGFVPGVSPTLKVGPA
jgi:SpoIID/LytB domain protein